MLKFELYDQKFLKGRDNRLTKPLDPLEPLASLEVIFRTRSLELSASLELIGSQRYLLQIKYLYAGLLRKIRI